jgi:transcriptional regulator with XRE-family HTH domain
VNASPLHRQAVMQPNKYPRFAALLRRKMTANHMMSKTLAAAISSNRSSVGQWRSGYRLPDDRFLGGLADLLDAPGLVLIAAEYRDGICVECAKPFRMHPKAGSPRRYCSPRCKSEHNKRKARDANRSTRADRLAMAVMRERAAEELRDNARREAADRDHAIAAFCRACEWDGICKMPSCELRPFSPLPLAKEAVA